MSRLDNVIEQVKARRKRYDFWIFDENNNIKKSIVCGDTLLYLEELKDYEIEVTDEELQKFLKQESLSRVFTYNGNCNCSEDISIVILDSPNSDCCYAAFCVHIGIDARHGFTDWFMCEFSYESELFGLESATQHKYFGENNRYCADVNLFSEGYYVYDYEIEDEIGYFYDLEVDDLMESIIEEMNKNDAVCAAG